MSLQTGTQALRFDGMDWPVKRRPKVSAPLTFPRPLNGGLDAGLFGADPC